MKKYKNFSLKDFNTFALNVVADDFFVIESANDCANIECNKSFFLGKGSNVLFLKNRFLRPVFYNQILYKKIVQEDEKFVIVEIGSGEDWNDLVIWAVGKNYGGIENLALIPGSIGGAVVQNIGAYGKDLSDSLVSVCAWDFQQKKSRVFTKEECKLGYRDSIFKQKTFQHFFITSVQIKLSKYPIIDYSYLSLNKKFEQEKVKPKTIRDIHNMVSRIRKFKLPDFSELPNAGSFFKNPILEKQQAKIFRENFLKAPFFSLKNGSIKVPAAYLIEQVGMKGIREKNVGTAQNQGLVLINYGVDEGQEIVDFAEKIREKVFTEFSIKLIPEVCFV